MQTGQRLPRPTRVLAFSFELFKKAFPSIALLMLISFVLTLLTVPVLNTLNRMRSALMHGDLGAMALSGAGASLGGSLLSLVVNIVSIVITFAMWYVIRACLQERDRGIGYALKEAFSHAGNIIGQALLLFVLSFVAVFVFTLISTLFFFIGAQIGVGFVAFLGILLYIAVLVAAIIVFVRISLYPFLNVLEDEWFFAAFKRSWELTRGNAGRIFGYALAYGLVVLAVLLVLGIVTGLMAVVMTSTPFTLLSLLPLLIVLSFATPFGLCLTATLALTCLPNTGQGDEALPMNG